MQKKYYKRFKDVINVRKTISYLYKLAFTDLCTGLKNRNAYEEKLSRLRGGKDSLRNLRIVFIDIDNLKYINDNYGHYIGDKALIAIADIIKNLFRTNDIVGRIGGDEFLVILQNRDLEELEELIKKFDADCSNEAVEVEKERIPISIAKGFAKYDSNKDSSFVDVFNRADDAMYENKREIKGLK